MANNYLLKMGVREKVLSLEKDGQVFSPDVKKFLHESLNLPESTQKMNRIQPLVLSGVIKG
jgi:hypothetical protein